MAETLQTSEGRYYVDQFYIGSFEIHDSFGDKVMATCPYFFDSEGSDKEIEEDARRRAEAMAAGLNAIGFDWKPLPRLMDE